MRISACILWLAALLAAGPAAAACVPGAYGPGDGDFVVVVPTPAIPPPGQRYLFRDGRRGSTADATSPVMCTDDAVSVGLGAAAASAGRNWRCTRPTRDFPASRPGSPAD